MVKEVCSPISTTKRLPASELSPGALSSPDNPDNPRRRGDQGSVPASSLPPSGTGSTPTPAAHSIPPLTPRRSAAHAEDLWLTRGRFGGSR
jgi:hypothetical protein